MNKRLIQFLLVLCTLLPNFAHSQGLLYKKELKFGSLRSFNPVSHYFNAAFDTVQNPFWFTQSGYFRNHSVLWERIKKPNQAIRDSGGYGQFITREFIGLRSIPNYFLHILGGGYDYRLLAEWYEAHSFPWPYTLAFATAYLANIGNEAVETTSDEVKPTDHIADLYFFDIVGKLLFLNDAIVRFCYDKLGMRAWHYQPMINLPKVIVENAGANYIFRPRFYSGRLVPFFHMGLTLLAGMSWMGGNNNYTLAAGITPTDPLKFQGDFIAGLYWDREGVLLASLTLNGSSNLAFRLNIYPDVISLEEYQIGIFSGYGRSGFLSVGVQIFSPVGISTRL